MTSGRSHDAGIHGWAGACSSGAQKNEKMDDNYCMPGRCMPDQNIEKHEVQAHTAVYDSLDTRERWKEFGITRHNTPHLLNMCISTVWPERLVEKAPTNGLAKNESPSFLFHSTVRLISYDTPIVTNILRTHTHTHTWTNTIPSILKPIVIVP